MDEVIRAALRALEKSDLGREAAALEEAISRVVRGHRPLWQEAEEVLNERRELARQLRALRDAMRRAPPEEAARAGRWLRRIRHVSRVPGVPRPPLSWRLAKQADRVAYRADAARFASSRAGVVRRWLAQAGRTGIRALSRLGSQALRLPGARMMAKTWARVGNAMRPLVRPVVAGVGRALGGVGALLRPVGALVGRAVASVLPRAVVAAFAATPVVFVAAVIVVTVGLALLFASTARGGQGEEVVRGPDCDCSRIVNMGFLTRPY